MLEVNFKRNPGEGQMTFLEREWLYNAILKYKPSTGIEIGTWKGGGSTYIITSAFQKLGNGHLNSFEFSVDFLSFAEKLYQTELAELKPFVSFYLGRALERIPKIFPFGNARKVDLLMLDGDDDSEQTLAELSMVNYLMKPGGLIFCHDWYGSGKQHLTRHLLDNGPFERIFHSEAATGACAFIKH